MTRITDTKPTPMTRLAQMRSSIAPSSDREVVFLAGIVGLAVGFGLIWLPLGVIIPSVLLIVLAVISPPEAKE